MTQNTPADIERALGWLEKIIRTEKDRRAENPTVYDDNNNMIDDMYFNTIRMELLKNSSEDTHPTGYEREALGSASATDFALDDTIGWEDIVGPPPEKDFEDLTEAEKICRLIEKVDLSDTAALDEIDVRARCLVMGWPYDPIHLNDYLNSRSKDPAYHAENYPRYTRSLNAIETILPKEVDTALHYEMTGWENGETNFVIIDGWCGFKSPILPCKKLAMLHAAVQYIGHKKSATTTEVME